MSRSEAVDNTAILLPQINYLARLFSAEWEEECWIAEHPDQPARCEEFKAAQAAVGAFRTVFTTAQVEHIEQQAVKLAFNALLPKDRKTIVNRHPKVASLVQSMHWQLGLAA